MGPASRNGKALFWVLAGAAVGFALWLVIRAQGGSNLDPDQAWFWRDGWFAGELEADQQIAAGTLTHHDSDEAFLQSLADRTKPE